MKKIFVFFAFSLVVLLGCEKPEEEENIPKENILNENAHIVNANSILNFNPSSLTLDVTGLNFTPEVGDIILSSPTLTNPTGVFSKIITLIDNGSTVNCSIQTSNLNEAFKQLYINYNYSSNYSDNINLRASNLQFTFPTNYQLTPGFTVNGNINFNIPDVRISYSKEAGDLTPREFEILANVNTTGSNINMQANGALNVPERVLHTYNNLPIIEVPIIVAGIPLIVPFYQRIDLNTLPLSITGKMKYSLKPELSASLGINYKDGEWNNLSGFNIGADAIRPFKSDFNASMDANITFINPSYKIGPLLDPTLYLFFNMPNSLVGKIQTQVPNYSLKYKLGIDLGIHYNFWLGINGEKTLSVPIYETTLKEGNFNNPTINFTGIPSSDNQHSITVQGYTFIASSNISNPSGWNYCTAINSSSVLHIMGGLMLAYSDSNIVVTDLSSLGKIHSIKINYFNNCNCTYFSACDTDDNFIVSASGGNTLGVVEKTINVGDKIVKRFSMLSAEAIIYSIEIETVD